MDRKWPHKALNLIAWIMRGSEPLAVLLVTLGF
jgi:hypothetical protein